MSTRPLSEAERRRKRAVILGIKYRLPSGGTQRRIQALMAIGWRSRDIATRCGWATPQAVTEILTARKYVFRGTAAAIARVYEDLSMTAGPSEQTRRRAARKGWPPPLAWNDIDDPTETPTDWHYVDPDRATTITDLDTLGLNVTEVSRRLGIRRDNLERWCQRNGMSETYLRLAGREFRAAGNQYVEAS